MARDKGLTVDLTVGEHRITITSPEKMLWPDKGIKKLDYLHYLVQLSNFSLPFLQHKVLTVIRFPHGMTSKEAFFQKNRPTYTPDFIPSHEQDGIDYIVCNDLATYLWLGNQLAIEFHIPFQQINSDDPVEIVLDLDPPSREYFALAVEAALMIKEVLDQLNIIGFVKTSGNKGLQIHIPLLKQSFSYDETRLFMTFLAQYLMEREPNWFTTERMKKNRGNRLYLDIVQHSKGKTIIAPYSLRGNVEALVSTPLWWDEVNDSLAPDQFPIERVIERIQDRGCPFRDYFKTENESFHQIIEWLQHKL